MRKLSIILALSLSSSAAVASTTENGLQMNRLALNALSLNALSLNALSLNALTQEAMPSGASSAHPKLRQQISRIGQRSLSGTVLKKTTRMGTR